MNERSLNALSIAACVLAAAIIAYHVLAPEPSQGQVVQVRTNEERRLRSEIVRLRHEVTAVRAQNELRLWTQPSDQVMASAMAIVNKLAASKGLKIVAFRPQRQELDSGVTRHPFLVSIEGDFPNLIGFMSTLETGKEKLAVNTVQIASSDGASSRVAATIGIIAYREQEISKQ